MRIKSILAALLLMVAGLQTARAQGFRVCESDGTVVQFSLRTDSIVFYEDIGTDVDINFDPFTPVNRCIVGTWWKSKYETMTFNEDGTTDYMEDATYKFLPYQGIVVIYNASNAPLNFFKVLELSAKRMIVCSPDGSNISIWSKTVPVYLVKSITLSETSISLFPDDTKRLTATVLPEDADNKDVVWETSDEKVAQIINYGLVLAVAEGTCTITCSAMDGSGVKAECQVKVRNSSGITDGHEWVDLNLPSGTLWATTNVGSNNPDEYGDYFAWGETTTKNDYSWSTYKHCKGSEKTITKYCSDRNYGYNGFTDNKTELDPADDAATANWGSSWQMPSRAQCQELINSNYTITEWTTLNGKYGRKITSKTNGKSIFLPATGKRSGTSLEEAGSRSYNWSRSRATSSTTALCYYGNSDSMGADSNTAPGSSRFRGLSVRPVRKKN